MTVLDLSRPIRAKRARPDPGAPEPEPELFPVAPSAPPNPGDSPWLPELPLFRNSAGRFDDEEGE